MDHDDEILPLSRKSAGNKSEEEETSENEVAATQTMEKKLSFATSIYGANMSYHTISGEERRGLLVDPGAAFGLIGSETLRDLLESCIQGDMKEKVNGCDKRPQILVASLVTPKRLWVKSQSRCSWPVLRAASRRMSWEAMAPFAQRWDRTQR